MKRTKYLIEEDITGKRKADLEKMEAEFHYVFWESNYNPITMWPDSRIEDNYQADPKDEKVERYLSR